MPRKKRIKIFGSNLNLSKFELKATYFTNGLYDILEEKNCKFFNNEKTS